MKTYKRKTYDVSHTGPGDDVRVPHGTEKPEEYVAEIVAKRLFGKSAYMRHCTLESYSPDMRSCDYQAFVGIRNADGSMKGKNIWVYIREVDA